MQAWILGFLMSLVVLGVGYRWKDRHWDSSVRLTFFDVGQGDASLIQIPGGRSFLVDAGGGFGDWDYGSRVLALELAQMGITSLDGAIISHSDQDHAYGFLGISPRIPFHRFWYNQALAALPQPPLLLRRLLLEAGRADAQIFGLSRPETLVFPGGELEFFPVKVSGTATNDLCLALSVRLGNCRALFTGDLEAKGEAALLRFIDKKYQLLKVAHHGSYTSSTSDFLRKVQPDWAVISVGSGNSYGHPHEVTLDKLRSYGIDTLRTDFHGFVKFRMERDGTLSCESARGACGVRRCQELVP